MVGDRVAVVAADTREQAIAAAQLVDVEYEELKPVLSVADALSADSPTLHPDIDTYGFFGAQAPGRSHSNIQGERVHEHGDVAAAFSSATRVFENTYTIPKTIAGYLEPRASLVWLEGDDIHIITTNKSPFRLRDQMATTFGLEPEKMILKTGAIGGDFGGKGLSVDEHILVVLAQRTSRKVRAVTTFADDMSYTSTRHAGTITLRTAVDDEGRFLGHEGWVTLDGGAYAAAKPGVSLAPGKAHVTLAGYHVPAARVEVKTVYTNTVPAGNARSPAQPQNAFAAESHVDSIADALGIDRLEFRMRNAIRDGGIDVGGEAWEKSMMPETLTALRDEMAATPIAAGESRGIALAARPMAAGSGAVVISVTPDARIKVMTGVTDQGGGALTMLQRVVAENLGVELGSVVVETGDTSSVPYDYGVGGSRVTPIIGGAALDGAAKLRDYLETNSPGLPIGDQLSRASIAGDVSILGESTNPSGDHSSTACFVDLSVDKETGAVAISRCVAIVDVGTIVNPISAMGQLVGGIAAGIGMGLMEELELDDGVVIGGNLSDYKLPSMKDMPDIKVVLIESDVGAGPFGAKSVGELTNSLIAPAVAGAVRSSCGVSIHSLPITAQKIYAAMQEAPGSPG
jgi:CO/xanthine dehydrogenase Mo-binding subunit